MFYKKRRFYWMIAILCIVIAYGAFSGFFEKLISEVDSTTTSTTESQTGDTTQYGPYTVSRVVDGDTIVVSIDGVDTKVRLIGVNTPESVDPDESENTEEGEVASEYTQSLLTGKEVMLEYDEDRYDVYGRTLAYVYLDGEMVNELLLKEGYAEVMTVEPNTRYEDTFNAYR